MASKSSESIEEELTIPEEDEEKINIGLYIGGRNINGERDGKGWAILPNGDQYDGHYRKGQRHGIGLYVFFGGARYLGQYRCGVRSGRGVFIYPDGSYYEGCWRRNLRHGKGRYCYVNGDVYCGGWYRGRRHGVGIYTVMDKCGPLSFKGTWRNNVRVGPFQLTFGSEEKCVTLHGIWDYLYPQGPAVFSFDNKYLLMGYFQTPGKEAWLSTKKRRTSTVDDIEECTEEGTLDGTEEGTASQEKVQDVWVDEPSLWFAQDICKYDFSLLPQEPVPLPLSDSELSVCSLSTVPTELLSEKQEVCAGEGEEEGGEFNLTCECECSTSEIETSSSDACAKPCAIEKIDQKCI